MASHAGGQQQESELTFVDCDIHIKTEDDAEIVDRLPEPFRSKGLYGPGSYGSQYKNPVGGFRGDAYPEEGAAGSKLSLVREQLLDALPIEYAIITGGICMAMVAHPNRRYAAAVCRAYNDWVIEKWTSQDDRIKASLGIAPHAVEQSVEEIHRLGDHPDIVQVLIGSGTRIPLGQRDYWPIYEAAESEGLPLGMHVGPKGSSGIGNPNNPAGHSSTYIEAHTHQLTNYYGQLASMVLEGVFEAFPDFQFVMIEGEFGWVPDLMDRMDRLWRAIGDAEAPWLSKPPSEYVKSNVKFTTQPIPEPPEPGQLAQVMEMIDAERTLMWSSDYPHWDGDYTPDLLFRGVPESTKRAVLSETAKDLYGL